MINLLFCKKNRSNASRIILPDRHLNRCRARKNYLEPMAGIEPATSSLPRKRSTPELHRRTTVLRVWVVMDSNHRSRKTADLQSAPFGRSGNYPYFKTSHRVLRSLALPVCFFLSLLSDSNQRPRDYKSRALAN